MNISGLKVARRAFVLHSGGIDSSTALVLAAAAAWKARSESGGSPELNTVVSVGINYGQRHKKEMDAALEFCSDAGIERMIVNMTSPPLSMLTDPSADIPEVSYEDLPHGISPTYVPFRNGQLLSTVAGIAQGWVMEQERDETRSVTAEATIWFGAHAEDAQRWAYPDCTPEFVGAMAAAILIGTYNKVRLITPFIHWTKDQIVEEGEAQGADWSKTWSCYKGEEIHCGVCPTCRARKEAFNRSGVEDPTEYAQ
jgi:7-cyano-7-deazaguanine synthase